MAHAGDCPGHGHPESPTDRGAYTMHVLADLHHEIASALGCVPAVVMGFPMGGAVAEEYALRHPSAVRGLVLLASAGGDWLDADAEADIAEALPALSEGMATLWERRAQRLYPEELARLDPPTLIAHGTREEASIVDAARRLHSALPRSRYEVVPDTGHCVQNDDAVTLSRILRDFLVTL